MTIRDCSIALAGCVQHTWWAHRLAQHGEYREDYLQSAVDSILCTDPGQVLDVYGGLGGLKTGLDVSANLLTGGDNSPLDRREAALLMGYVGHLLRLGAAVSKNSKVRTALAEAIAMIKHDMAGQDTGALVDRAAQAYVENISPLTPRIMIQGNGIYLRNETFAAGIRTHLLAAVRSAVLWRQCGGRLWLMVFQRNAYLRKIRELRAAVDA